MRVWPFFIATDLLMGIFLTFGFLTRASLLMTCWFIPTDLLSIHDTPLSLCRLVEKLKVHELFIFNLLKSQFKLNATQGTDSIDFAEPSHPESAPNIGSRESLHPQTLEPNMGWNGSVPVHSSTKHILRESFPPSLLHPSYCGHCNICS